MPSGKPPEHGATQTPPDWERVIEAAAHLQDFLPDAVLVGGTASALHAGHRISYDADHVLTDLKPRFDTILAELESVAGWRTARVARPVMILGSLDGIETGVRQLIRSAPLETEEFTRNGRTLRIPTRAEMLRIKGVLILKRNATRDYLDFIALADRLGDDATIAALTAFDSLYPQDNGASAVMQLQIQLAKPQPYDLDAIGLTEYRNLDPRWHSWDTVRTHGERIAALIFDRIIVG